MPSLRHLAGGEAFSELFDSNIPGINSSGDIATAANLIKRTKDFEVVLFDAASKSVIRIGGRKDSNWQDFF